MQYWICLFLGINAAFALAFGLMYALQRKKQLNQRVYLFIGLCLSSAIWSAGFASMYIQTTEHLAFVSRAVGIAGAILFLFFSQTIVNVVPAINRGYHIVFDCIAALGFLLYFPAMRPEHASFYMTDFGMSYIYTPDAVNFILLAYFVITGGCVLSVIIWMIKGARRKRSNAFGRRFLVVAGMIFFGAIFDLLLPAIGRYAIPGSVVTQFWGIVVVWTAMNDLDKALVNISNMSNYLYDSLATPVAIFTPEMDLKIVNDSAAAFLGTCTEALVFNPKKITDYFDISREQCFTKEQAVFTTQLTCKTNNHPCNLLVNRIVDKYRDCIGFIMSINDMSDHVEAMEKLEAARKNADAANKAKSEFLAHMSHEIRTPMNAIMGFSELALKEDISEAAKEDIKSISEASANLLGIINDILDISKIESGKMELVCDKYNPAEMLSSLCSMIDIRARAKNLKFIVDTPEEFPKTLYGDRTRIREILVNLLSNAVKYTKEGSITLKLRPVEKISNTMTIEFSVEDTGIGIRPEAIDSLFDAFQRADIAKNATIEGTGLGLAIVKSYVEMMDGTISVTSEYGVGSKFTVRIPQIVVDGSHVKFKLGAAKTKLADNNLGKADYSKYFVLVVDDNIVNRVLITKTLEKYKIRSEAVESGEAAIAKCRENTYDIIFMDQMMPVMDGVEAMKIIRRDCPAYVKGSGNRIVALTANAIVGVREELMNEGFDDYLEKPLVFSEFERVLRNE